MPRYQYYCNCCAAILILDHLSSEEEADCPKCLGLGALKKMLTRFRPLASKTTVKKKVGDETEEFIKEARQDLKQQKQNLHTTGNKEKE